MKAEHNVTTKEYILMKSLKLSLVPANINASTISKKATYVNARFCDKDVTFISHLKHNVLLTGRGFFRSRAANCWAISVFVLNVCLLIYKMFF